MQWILLALIIRSITLDNVQSKQIKPYWATWQTYNNLINVLHKWVVKVMVVLLVTIVKNSIFNYNISSF